MIQLAHPNAYYYNLPKTHIIHRNKNSYMRSLLALNVYGCCLNYTVWFSSLKVQDFASMRSTIANFFVFSVKLPPMALKLLQGNFAVCSIIFVLFSLKLDIFLIILLTCFRSPHFGSFAIFGSWIYNSAFFLFLIYFFWQFLVDLEAIVAGIV